MSPDDDAGAAADVLANKRDATRYRILVEIAQRQPAVNQQEIADAIGVTSQAVSDYLQGLIEADHVRKHGRGRYEVTKEGVDWLISQTDALQAFLTHVSEDVIGQVDVETAVAETAIAEGETVALSMEAGVLRARSGESEAATAVAITDAAAGRDVGLTNFEGVVEYDLGTVTVASVPPVREGGSTGIDSDRLAALAADHDLVASAGTEAFVAARGAEAGPDIRFGTVDAVQEAATKGLDVLLLATPDDVSAHTDALRDHSIAYEVVDVTGAS